MQERINQLKLSLRKSEYLLYPIIEEFVRPDKKISDSTVESFFLSFDDIKKEFSNFESIGNFGQYEQAITNLRIWLNRIIKLARKRDRIDTKKNLLDLVISLREFSFFTSAVTLGIVIYSLNFESHALLFILGLLGILMYFAEDIKNLILLIASFKRTSRSNGNPTNELESLITQLEKTDYLDNKDELQKLEDILVSGEYSSTLNHEEIIKIKHLYFHSIKEKMMIEIRSSNSPDALLAAYEQFNRYLENIVQVFVIAVVSVDYNRPAPKINMGLAKLLNIRMIGKFLGYILLNAVSYNVLFLLFKENIYSAIEINIIIILIFFLILTYIEKKIVREY